MIRLRIGVIGREPGWELLLTQLGIPYSIDIESENSYDFSVVILTKIPSRDILSKITEYLKNGGAVLCSNDIFGILSKHVVRNKFIKYILPAPNSLFTNVGLIDIYSKGWFSPLASEMSSNKDDTCVYIGEIGGGLVLSLPFNSSEIIIDQRSGNKSFYASGRRLPFERVSLVAKGAVRKLVERSIELLHHRLGLPYVHRWYFPYDQKNIFILRVDTDCADRQQVKSLQKVLSSTPTTWFLDVKTQEGFISDYLAKDQREIGIHCYAHKMYSNYVQIKKDINKAINVLQKYGFDFKGYTSPFGRWSKDLGNIIAAYGFEYSSEFSYDYDNFPSFPYIATGFSSAMQIPIHPIAIGNLRRQGFSEDEMWEYYNYVMKEKYQSSEPLIFYHHPKNQYNGIIALMLEWMKEKEITANRMIEYVLWWKKRVSLKDSITFHDQKIYFNTDKSYDDVWFHIKNMKGEEVWIPPQSEADLIKLKWVMKDQSPKIPSDFKKIKRYNLSIPLIKIEDYITNLIRR